METMKQPLVILTGARTAAGKTALSIHLAQAIGGEIISADSMQVYKKAMDIGSAKIRPEEMQGVPHYLVDEASCRRKNSMLCVSSRWQKRAMEEIYAQGTGSHSW